MALYLLKDEGKPSLSYTMVIVAFLAITLWLIAFVIGCAFGLPVPAFDGGAAMAYFSPIAALYGFRKHGKVKAKANPSEAE